jgi:type I restriction enzyme M protein
VAELNFGGFDASHIDLFGDAYEFLISNYAANAGKSGGEFFTPQHVSKLIAQLAMHKQTSVNKIYDPACGSGSLLLQAKKHFDAHIIEDGFFGQEINHTTYNLARMNMFLHNINYDKFNIQLGNTLLDPHFGDDKPFDAIVSNPPYSVKWIGSDDPTLINDERFAPAGARAQIQGRLLPLCCTHSVTFPARPRSQFASRHLLPGRGRAENPPVSGG